MKNSICIFLFLLFSPAVFAQTFIVERMVDGEVIRLTNGREIRLIGIDVPESQPNDKARRLAEETGNDIQKILSVGKKAMNFIEPLLEGKEVRLEFDKETVDTKGRFWAYVYDVGTYKGKTDSFAPPGYEMNGDEIFINATIIKSGYASPLMLPPNVKHSRLFKKLFSEAQENKSGLWR